MAFNHSNHFMAAALMCLVSNLSFGAATNQLPNMKLAPKLQPYVDSQVMAGAVILVADKNMILDLESVGYSDLSRRKPMQVNDLFWIASMTKAMTAAALMMLVDEGKIRVDDPVEKYIPDFKNVKVAQPDGKLVPPSHPILIREILSHTSGLRFLNSKDRQIIDSVPLETSIKNDLLESLLFDPGTKYEYSNEGIDTAGRIIEIVAGIPYEQFLQDRLFTPLKMVDTTFRPNAAQLRRLVKSYKTRKYLGGLAEVPIYYLTSPLDGSPRYPSPAGGLFSTAQDVCRFCQMLVNGGTFEGKTFLSTKSVHEMTTKQTGPRVDKSYGFGLDVADETRYGHGGAYTTSMNVDRGQIRIFLVQQASAWARGNPENDFKEAVQKMMSTGTASSVKAGSQTPAK